MKCFQFDPGEKRWKRLTVKIKKPLPKRGPIYIKKRISTPIKFIYFSY
jgi:hypothetical protein